jgi:hypothetical protein
MYAFLDHMRATCPAHFPVIDLIALTIFDEAYKFKSEVLCNIS